MADQLILLREPCAPCPPRPVRDDPRVRQIAADRIFKEVVDWLGKDYRPQEQAEIREQLAESIDQENDGYSRARYLERNFHWECDTELTEILDSANPSRAYDAIVEEWVCANDITLRLPINTPVRVRARKDWKKPHPRSGRRDCRPVPQDGEIRGSHSRVWPRPARTTWAHWINLYKGRSGGNLRMTFIKRYKPRPCDVCKEPFTPTTPKNTTCPKADCRKAAERERDGERNVPEPPASVRLAPESTDRACCTASPLYRLSLEQGPAILFPEHFPQILI